MREKAFEDMNTLDKIIDQIECRAGAGDVITIDQLKQIRKEHHAAIAEQCSKNGLREELATYAHDAWSGWMMYMFRNCSGTEDSSQLIPKWAVDRWTRQSQMPYSKISEDEKNSDRLEADEMLKIFRKHLLLAATRVE